MHLADQKCVPCRGGVPAMDRARANELLRELGAGWRLNDEGHLEREYRVRNFREAMDLANKVADIAEQEGHHQQDHPCDAEQGEQNDVRDDRRRKPARHPPRIPVLGVQGRAEHVALTRNLRGDHELRRLRLLQLRLGL